MILVSMIVPALILCLVVLYAELIRRFFLIKSKIPFWGLRGMLGRTAGKRRRLAAMGALIFAVSFWARVAIFRGNFQVGLLSHIQLLRIQRGRDTQAFR